MYLPPLTANVDDPRTGITGASAEVSADKLRHTWEEIHFKWDICCATSRSQIDL